MNDNQNNDGKLTDKQKKLVEDNHNLIYSYAKKKHISSEKWYDVLAIGLCKAARSFDPDKGKFSTWAYRFFDNEIRTCWNKENKKSKIPESFILAYDAVLLNEDDSQNNSYIDFFSDTKAYEDIVHSTMMLDIVNDMNDVEKCIFELILHGYNQQEIAAKVGRTRQSVGKIVNGIRRKVLDYIYC